MSSGCSVAFITVPNAKVADRVAGALLGQKLAGCVNQIPRLKSLYWWEGKIEKSREILLMVKTRTSLIPALTRCVRKNHPYTVPEVISLPIAQGHAPYLQWLRASTQRAGSRRS